MKFKCKNPQETVKEAMWLAWQACGGTSGWGCFQDRDGVTRDDVWNNIHDGSHGGDYPTATGHPRKPDGKASADYVFGRMMKLRLSYDAKGIEFPDSQPTSDYQRWFIKYRTYEDLLNAAAKNVNGGK